jgi:hypothetical protein
MPALSIPFLRRLRARVGLALGILLAADSVAETVLPLGSRLAVCFPPAAPVFGDAIPDGGLPLRQGQFVWSPPELLADYVNETFYPPLSTRLIARSLSPRLEARLEAYRVRRSTLLGELADQMLTLQGAEAATRESELRAFAAQQNPRILMLEREAEALRRALIDGGLLQSSVDWSVSRNWRIGAIRQGNDQAEKEAQFQVIRAAAYYESGFTIEQRGLLLELAAELQVRARAARPIPQPRSDDPAAIYFSPAMSRFRLPTNATPRLTALLGRFNGLKSEIKQELREEVFEQDRAAPRERASAFEALAERTEPRLAELERIADEIRAEMAVIPRPRLRAGPQLPPELALQIETYRQHRREFIEEFEQAVRTAMDLHRSKISVRPVNEKGRAELARMLAEDRISLRAKVAQTFRTEQRERYDEMHRRHRSIQEHLKVVAAGKSDGETGEPLTAETLLRGYTDAEERFNAFGREEVIYRGYWHAMMMPGLSPEQRRLLFGSAWVGLAQPLPAGEPMPTGSQPTPRS